MTIRVRVTFLSSAEQSAMVDQVYLTQYIISLGSECQLLHKTVNLLFQLVIVINKLTILWGS